ncbi:HlyD family efflux transporter periplasmic adaptor subunit [uncultured Pseudoteredinibacter sp.]|uniref:HlyD family secretion protein n=1 Tax=uncultured Pseudoteredinibacter sp. TaxID=1641701 RepID=UPI0026077722|nr:HlyD family efflux transporter periplasmic adaptor subunit [uncultured Pseudoteredinibacter sp.]
MYKLNTIIARLLLGTSLIVANFASAQSLLISGFVEARFKQQFSTPDSDSWQLQIKWLEQEGKQVKAGDTVVVFDAAALESEVEAEEAKLRKTEAEAKKTEQKLRLERLEAESLMKIARLELEKADLDASIPASHLTKITFEKYQLEKKKKQLALKEQEQALAQKEVELENQIATAKIQYKSAQAELGRKQVMLKGLTQKAERSGAVVYVRHPWTGQTIKAGDTVQKGFVVLEIPDTSQLYIKAWLNEVDIARVKTGPVELYVDALNKAGIKGQLKHISQQGESRPVWGEAYYHALEVELDDSSFDASQLLPGMSVMVRLSGNEQQLAGEI